jgi:hypothetical protein
MMRDKSLAITGPSVIAVSSRLVRGLALGFRPQPALVNHYKDSLYDFQLHTSYHF